MNYSECPCSGTTLDKFLRPTVLAVLARTPNGQHGYAIAQELRLLPIFANNPPDPTGLYRTLKAMETEGLLSAGWDTEGSGPAKRVYALTSSGLDCLQHWADTLQIYSRNLLTTLDFVKASIQEPSQ